MTTNDDPRQQTPEKLPNNYRTTAESLLNHCRFSRFHKQKGPPLETTGYGSQQQTAEKVHAAS
jgi:hypothetical protein